MPRWLKYLLLFLLVLLASSIPLAMQPATGSIQGKVADESGPVARATVEARNVVTGVVYRATSDASGRYTLGSVRAGSYSLWVTAEGHDSIWVREITVERGQTAHEDIRLPKISKPTPTES